MRKPNWGPDVFSSLRNVLVKMKWPYFPKIWGMVICPTANLSQSAKLDRINPKGVDIGAETYVAFDTAIRTQDLRCGIYIAIRIGRRCIAGVRSMVLPSIEISDRRVIGSRSVVTKNMPLRALVAGSPTKVVKGDVRIIARYRRMERSDEACDFKHRYTPKRPGEEL